MYVIEMTKKPKENAERVSLVTGKSRIYLPDARYPKELSVMQNRMIEAWNSMNIDEKRIFVLASPLIRLANVSEQTCFSISAKDYADACGISVSSAYHQLKDAADALRGRYFSYINTKGKRVSVHWVIRIEYSEAEISFYFPDEILYMLSIFNKDNPYTKFNIETALSLRGAHALHFYQLLKQHELIGYREFSIEEFRNTFEIEHKYKLFNNLRVRLIEPSIDEINQKTDLKITYMPINKGKKIIALRFSIANKNKSIKTVKSEKSGKENDVNNITASKVFNILLKNSLIDEYKKHGESIEDIKSRIAQDFKSSKENIWIERLQEKGLIPIDCPF
jgi:plasmid replication initiation protein